MLYGGLLFQPLNLDLLEAYRPTDLRLRHFFEYFVLEQLYLQHPDVIVLTNILPDPINTYLAPYRGGIVDEINGKKVRTLDELASAFAETPEHFVIRMIGDGPPLVLDRNKVESARERIKAALQRLERAKSRRTARDKNAGTGKQDLEMQSIYSSLLGILLVANHRRAGEKGTGCSSTDEHAKAARACPRERDRPVLRLFSTLAKESAVFEARTRRCFVERPCPGDGGPGCESKLRGAGARRIWRKTAAKVEVIDYEANLALLEPTEKAFLDGITPLEIALDTVVGDRLAAWQLEPTGALLATEGLVTTVQMTQYPIDVGQFLTYRISIPMQYRENSYTVPLVKNNKLAGLLLRYDSRSQLLDAIPAPIITHF